MKRLVIGLALLVGCTTTTRQAEPPARAEAPREQDRCYVFESKKRLSFTRLEHIKCGRATKLGQAQGYGWHTGE
ncbi:hypothetical protein [Cystobacter fuscus]|uniref:hypothetical protein n=1 Tax=Cystobacter fuscus TaxID=43 RepID=UPI002B2DBF61|nr:hypothetical protein F0U63_00860 [Cystobacter fuscus]